MRMIFTDPLARAMYGIAPTTAEDEAPTSERSFGATPGVVPDAPANDLVNASVTCTVGATPCVALTHAPVDETQTEKHPFRAYRHLMKKKTGRFVLRIILAYAIIAAASALMLSGSPLLFVLGLIVQGAMYVHLIELQHSVLHLHAFESHTVSRWVGVMLGVPMMISFSDFQYKHLRHHKHLGTQLNTETFNYQHVKLNSRLGFMGGMFDYSRMQTLAQRLGKAFTGQSISDELNPLMEARIRQEYRIFGILLCGAFAACFATASLWPLTLWLAPLLAAEPVHFLLELPEHFGLPAHTNPDVFQNTRIWGGSWFARWFSHNTNYHLAHHYNQLIPMDNLPLLEEIIADRIPENSRSDSYPAFFISVMTGEIKPYRGDQLPGTAARNLDAHVFEGFIQCDAACLADTQCI